MALERIFKLVAASKSLIGLMESGLEDTRKVSPRKPEDFVRISGLSKMCPREEVICSLEGLSREETIDPELNLIFIHGHALHWALQNLILGPLGVLLGAWRCQSCGKLYRHSEEGVDDTESVSFTPRPEKCSCSEDANFIYHEQWLKNSEYRVSGHPDGFLMLPNRTGYGVFEAKSIGQLWKVKNAPQLDHVIQVQCYMWLTGLQWSVILYWHKSGKGFDSFIEHFVERDEDTITQIKSVLLDLQYGLKDGKLPKRICVNDWCDKAKDCPVKTKCFTYPDNTPPLPVEVDPLSITPPFRMGLVKEGTNQV